MSTVLKLGDFTFQNFEIPENINFGGSQHLAVHKLVGGGRVIDSMGRDDDPLEWSGMFSGENAISRARYLQALMVEGKAHTLTWGPFSYQVVIASFQAEFQRASIVPYRISCEIVKDNINLSLSAPPSDLTTVVKEDVETVVGAAKEVFVDEEHPSYVKVVKVQSLLKDIKDLVNATNSQIHSVKTAIEEAQAAITSEIASVSNQIQALTTLGGVIPGNSVSVGAMELTDSVVAINTAYQLDNISYLLDKSEKNVTAVDSAPNAKTVIVSGTTLYKVALDHYGDATMWDVIAKANGLTDVTISGAITLVIPPAEGTSI